MSKQLGRYVWRLLPGAIAATAIALLLLGGAFQSLEQVVYGRLFELRGPLPPDDRLAVVAIDDASLRELGRFPWPRRYYTELIDDLAQHRASVVVINMLWPEASSDDAQLAQALQRHGVTVLAQSWDAEGNLLIPVPELEQAAIATGHILRQDGADGLARQVEPFLQGVPALGIAALQAYSLVAAPVELTELGRPLWLNWLGPAAQVNTYSFVDVLRGQTPPQAFDGKIVLVGVTAAGLDPMVTPFDRNPPTSGLYLQATAIHNLWHNNALRPLGNFQLWLLLLTGAPVLSWRLAGWSTRQQLLAMVGLCGGWGGLSLLLFQASYWLPTVAPVSLFVATAATAALSDRLREDFLLRHQVAYLWHHYHHDLTLAALATDETQRARLKPPLPRPRGAISQVAQLADLAEQLGRSQAMQVAIAHTLPVGLLAADGNGIIWFCNPVAAQLCQTSVGYPIQSAVVPHWLSAAQWRASLEYSKTGNTKQYKNLRWGDRWFDVSLQALPDHAATVNPTSPTTLLILEEITEHKQAEAALQQAKEAALQEAERSAAASRAKGEFLAHMSHELRTPLNVILGFTQVIGHDQSLHADHRTHLKIINRSGQHLLGLINDVLEMSKIEAGRIQLNKSRFDLHHLLNDLEAMVRLKAQEKQLCLTVEAVANLPRFIATDEGKLRQVLLNLLGNAIKFTETGGVILRVSRIDSPEISATLGLGFEVEDTGIGIADNAVGQLFQPFNQLNNPQHISEGSGLGLAISQRFVQLMGGEITVSSTVNQGSVFQFYIQAEPANLRSAIPLKPKGRVLSLVPNHPTVRILIVEDQPENSQLLNQLLTPLGFHLMAAKHGGEGIDQWKLWQPHLILMDLRMPIMDGIRATQIIRNIEYDRDQKNKKISNPTASAGDSHKAASLACPKNHTKIIALTASSFEETKDNAIAIGCDDFLRKPIQENLLLEKISEHLKIQYLYQDAEEDKSIMSPAAILTPQTLAESEQSLSREWLQKLHDLAVRGDDRLMIDLISESLDTHTALAQTLTHWAKNFRFDEVLQFTQTKLHPGN